jgi:ABC-type Mn2+/Zn2+ transport system permease subunit
MNPADLLGPDLSLAFWPIVIGAIVNSACALLGCFLVLRRMSLLGDAISHAVLPGIVIAFFFAGRNAFGWLFVGAMAFGLLTTFLVESLRRWGNVPEDSAMGVVFTALFSIGVLLLSRWASDVHLDVSCVMYGDMDVATSILTRGYGGFEYPRVFPRMATALLAVIAFLYLFRKELKLVAFDPALATAMGFSAGLLHYLLMGMTAVVSVSAFEAIGSVLAVAMLIVPPATAQLLTDRLRTMLILSAVIGTLSSLLGYLLARHYAANSAGMMAVAAGLLYGAAVLFAPRYGIIAKTARSLALSARIAGEDILARLYRIEEASRRQATAVPGSTGPASAGELPAEPIHILPSKWIDRLARFRLFRNGEVRLAVNGALALTDHGRQTAESLVRSHRLWEAYLVQNFQLPLDHLHEPAERIEHFIGPELQQQLAESLPKTAVDPHGREIPAIPTRPDKT